MDENDSNVSVAKGFDAKIEDIISQVISPDATNQHVALGYGLYMIVLHGLWFGIVALLFTSKTLQKNLLRAKKRLNQACGVGLVTFGALLAVKS